MADRYEMKLDRGLYRHDASVGGGLLMFPLVTLTENQVENAIRRGVLAGVSRIVQRAKYLNISSDSAFLGILGPNETTAAALVEQNPNGLVVLEKDLTPGLVQGLKKGQINFLLEEEIIGDVLLDGPAGVLNQIYPRRVMSGARDYYFTKNGRGQRAQFNSFKTD